MRRSWKAITLTAAILLLLGTLATVSIASAAPQAAKHPKIQVLHFITHETSFELIDLGKKGFSPATRRSRPRPCCKTASRLAVTC